jgi:hypothetical protein
MEKFIEFTEKDIVILNYLFEHHYQIADELKSRKIGDTILSSYGYGNGFYLKLGGLKFSFENSSSTFGYKGLLKVHYKDVLIFNSQIRKNDRVNEAIATEISNLKVTDSYYRGYESRHNLELAFRYVMDLFEKELYLPYLENEKNQKLYNDMMYDEFEQIILGQKSDEELRNKYPANVEGTPEFIKSCKLDVVNDVIRIIDPHLLSYSSVDCIRKELTLYFLG